MKRILFAAAALCAAAGAPAQVDVGVSIGISQPGVYGRIDIGRFPQPQVVLATPVVIHAGGPRRDPVYLWVPPGHQKNWRKHCQRYDACGVPVYFVRDDWYERHVKGEGPRGEPRHEPKGKGHGHGHGHGRGRGHDGSP